MIINVSERTDIVQYYTKWLLNRFEDGNVLVRNPIYNDTVYSYDLNPELVDCITFCSKNYKPLMNNIDFFIDNYNTYFFYTITAYGNDIEPGVPSTDKSIKTLIRLSEIVGKKRLVWRYDPVLLTDKYTVNYHIDAFDKMASEISSYVSHCIFSFVDVYKKLERNFPELISFSEDDKNEILFNMGKIAESHDLTLQVCASDMDYSRYNIRNDCCRNADVIGSANDIEFKKMNHKGNRKFCHCVEHRDIGEYNTCLNKCKYCYANRNPRIPYKKYSFHNPDSPILSGHLRKSDKIIKANQKSFLKYPKNNCNLFDFV